MPRIGTPDFATTVNIPDTTEPRQRWVVQARKVPYDDRDVAHAHITEEDPAGFTDVAGADCADDDPRYPAGATVTYAVELTDEAAEEFRGASNLLSMTPETYSRIPDDVITPAPTPVPPPVPEPGSVPSSGRKPLEQHMTLPAVMLR